MARYPGATWKPLSTRFSGNKRMVAHNRVNLHVAVSMASSLHGYFNAPYRASSHFYVTKSGHVEQMVDTAYQAEADGQGNDATISVETQGGLFNANGEKWTRAQVEALGKLYAWAVKTHGIRLKIAQDSRPGESSKGLSWHRLGVDGNFPGGILAGRVSGGMKYSPSFGKICPGNAKIGQVDEVYAVARAILRDGAAPASRDEGRKPRPKLTRKQRQRRKVKALQRAVRVHVDGKWGPVTDRNLVLVREASRFGGRDFPDGKKATQRAVGTKADGVWGPKSRAAHDRTVAKIQRALGVKADCIWGPKTDAAWKTARANLKGNY